ncbi:hypothetical protein [Streptomyces sp. CoH17]|uniref:hypothetical protein n=1 Tax=Streptomyces sp. CoH17 TaxID=2992806 RepID=UPI0022702EA2|nr:hypothetical protein [Streptomyces sp. CoH17]
MYTESISALTSELNGLKKERDKLFISRREVDAKGTVGDRLAALERMAGKPESLTHRGALWYDKLMAVKNQRRRELDHFSYGRRPRQGDSVMNSLESLYQQSLQWQVTLDSLSVAIEKDRNSLRNEMQQQQAGWQSRQGEEYQPLLGGAQSSAYSAFAGAGRGRFPEDGVPPMSQGAGSGHPLGGVSAMAWNPPPSGHHAAGPSVASAPHNDNGQKERKRRR